MQEIKFKDLFNDLEEKVKAIYKIADAIKIKNDRIKQLEDFIVSNDLVLPEPPDIPPPPDEEPPP